jgi:Alkylmercury lyase
MSLPVPRRTAAELMDTTFRARWAERDRIGPSARSALREILDRFLSEGAPVAIGTLRAGAAAVGELDERDLVYVSEGRVVLAYPWSGTPTPFVTVLPDGRERWACCAIDALGIPAMLGEPVTVRAGCHHCAERFTLTVTPEGPVGDDGVMAWVGERDGLRGKACTGL